MPFTTLTFIAFFAVVFFGYHWIPKKCQWGWLLAASLTFYAWASPFYLLLLALVAGLTFVGACRIGTIQGRREARLAAGKGILSRDEKKALREACSSSVRRTLAGTLVAALSVLCAFKYLQFAYDNLVALMSCGGWSLPPADLGLLLPVGLSFYVFQSIGYVIDVARELVPPERNFCRHLLFVGYFPQILQGPIGSYGQLAPQLNAPHSFDRAQVVSGLERIAWGFFKKLVIANRISLLTGSAWSNPSVHQGFCWWFLCSALYAIQIYADFSGYMDIACGCSEMLGISLAENFNCPYFSANIPEYWRRWHMTLGEWFKNYLFYPILRADWTARIRKACGKSRYWNSFVPTSLALLVVWLSTGLWHGAAWGYVAWGLYHGLFIILFLACEPLRSRFHQRFPRVARSWAYSLWNVLATFLIVVVGYSIFKPGDLGITARIWRSACSSVGWLEALDWMRGYGFELKALAAFVLLLLVVDVVHLVRPRGTIRAFVRRMPGLVRMGGFLTLLWLIVFMGKYGAGLDQFEYFRF